MATSYDTYKGRYYIPITESGGAAEVILAAKAGYRVAILGWCLSGVGGYGIQFLDSGSTALTQPIELDADQPMTTMPVTGEPQLITKVGLGASLKPDAATLCAGYVVAEYVQDETT